MDPLKPKNFRLEPSWFLEPEFKTKVLEHWPDRGGGGILDSWKHQQQCLRRFMKGWGANLRGQFRRERKMLLEGLQALDSKEGLCGLDNSEWRQRYDIEKALMQLYAAEEEYWRSDTLQTYL
jgi:hypothetical protein